MTAYFLNNAYKSTSDTKSVSGIISITTITYAQFKAGFVKLTV